MHNGHLPMIGGQIWNISIAFGKKLHISMYLISRYNIKILSFQNACTGGAKQNLTLIVMMLDWIMNLYVK